MTIHRNTEKKPAGSSKKVLWTDQTKKSFTITIIERVKSGGKKGTSLHPKHKTSPLKNSYSMASTCMAPNETGTLGFTDE